MYNDELDMILEDAYEDGYYQALADMGYEFDDAEEDVDIFDEDCFDEAMEGPAREYRRRNNKGKSQQYIHNERLTARDDATIRKAKPRRTFENMPDGLYKKYKTKTYKQDMRRYDNYIRGDDTTEGLDIMKHSNRKMVEKLRSGGMSNIDALHTVDNLRDQQYGRRVR